MTPAVQVLYLLIFLSLLYEGAAIVALYRWRRRERPQGVAAPAVTILKPLQGQEPELYENLRSFCLQDYPSFQIVFGVQDAGDPAVAVVHRLQREFPERDPRLVVNARSIGPNRKVSNLHNMLAEARHEILVLSDADIRVGPDYLRAVVAPFADPTAGVVTCLYRGVPHRGIGSRLLAQQINEGFLPSVLVAQWFGSATFCGGATLALRRRTLEAVGGFAALADHLADDYRLAARVRARGLRTILSTYLVDTMVWEASLAGFYRHALRWSRTIRSVQPLGHAFSFLTYPVSLALLGALIGGRTGLIALGLALALRLMLHYAAKTTLDSTTPEGEYASWGADLLGFLIWLHALLGRRVRWRQDSFSVRPDGRMEKNDGAWR